MSSSSSDEEATIVKSRKRPIAQSSDSDSDSDAEPKTTSSNNNSKSRKRPIDSDSDSDSSDDSDSDSDAEESNKLSRKSKPKKRSRPAASAQLFETEAAVNDDDEEEEEEIVAESGLRIEEDSVTKRKMEARLKKRDQFLEKSAEELAMEIEERHNQGLSRARTSEWVDHQVTSREANLPTVTDPRLYLVKCKPGEEKNLVVRLMVKYMNLYNSPDCPRISSAFSPGVKGFIYVEARNEAHVVKAIRGLRDIFPSRVSVVPINEMTKSLTISEDKVTIKAGDLVRLRRFPYRGDIAKIQRVSDSGDKVVVLCVPRLDYAAFQLSWDERKARKARKFRPPKKFFNAEEVAQAGGRPDRQRVSGVLLDEFEGDFFNDGFLQKEMSIRQVQTKDVDPSLEELQLFRGGSRDGSQDDISKLFEDGKLLDQVNALKSTSHATGPTSHLAKGDMVRVKEGDLEHLRGRVLAIDTQNQMVRIQLIHEEIRGKEIDLPGSQLMKYFQVGDHIKAIGGVYSGETGSVVKVIEYPDSEKEWVAVVFTDSGKEVQVLFRDLRESAEISVGQDSLGNYKMYDKVLVGQGQIGVIVAIGNEDFRVIGQDGVVRTMRMAELRKRNSARDSALDANEHAIKVNDMVKVISGPHANFEGTIKHMHRSILFLHSRMKTENGGIFVERARNVQTAGVRFKAPVSGLAKQRGRGRGLSIRGRGGARGGGGGRDELMGKSVKIKAGRYKGFVGVVVNATESMARVELHGRSKQVNVKREQVMVVGDSRGEYNDSNRNYNQFSRPGAQSYSQSATPLHGSATPLHGSATPLHGSATPLHGSATPLHEPSTPGVTSDAWNAAVSNAPVPATPADNGSWNNDGSGNNGRTDYGASNFVPATPGFSGQGMATPGAYFAYGTPAPATPHTPATPGGEYVGAGAQSALKRGTRVKILSGEFANRTGELMEALGSDGVVKVDGVADVKFIPLSGIVEDA